MAGHRTGAHLLPTPLLPPSAGLRSTVQEYLGKPTIRPLLSQEVPQSLLNTYPVLTPTQPQSLSLSSSEHINIPPLLPTPAKIPALMLSNLSQTRLHSPALVTYQSVISTRSRHSPIVISKIKPLISPRPKPLMSDSRLPGRHSYSQSSHLPGGTGVPLMSQTHSGRYPPPLMQQPPHRQQFSSYPTHPYMPPPNRHGFHHEQRPPLLRGHQPYQSQHWHQGRGRGRYSRGRGSGGGQGWRRDKPRDSNQPYYDETMFEDPWKELLMKAGVVESNKTEKPAVSNSTDQVIQKCIDSDTAKPDQGEMSLEPGKNEDEAQVPLSIPE